MSDRNFFKQLSKALEALSPQTEAPEPLVEPTKVENTPAEATVIKSLNVEQQMAVEIVYKPDEKDAHGEWMSEETIRIAEKSFRENEVVPNLFHMVETDQFEVTKSWVLDEDTDFEVDEDTVRTIKKGTWLAETHYTDTTLWELKKSKELGGLSLGGYGDVNADTGEITNLFFSPEEYLEATEEK